MYNIKQYLIDTITIGKQYNYTNKQITIELLKGLPYGYNLITEI